MSSSDDESLSGECDWCHDGRGLCDRPHLDDDRRFSIKLEETFEVETVRNDDKCFFSSLSMTSTISTCNFHLLQFEYSLSHAMQDAMSWRGWILKTMKFLK